MSLTTNIARRCKGSTSGNAPKPMRCGPILVAVVLIYGASPIAYGTTLEITTIKQGEPAPFSGDLFPPADSIRWALEIETCTERASVDFEHAERLHEVELERLRGLMNAEARADKQRIALLDAELEAARAWYRSPAFVAVVAATAGMAILLSSTILVQATAEVRD